MGWGTLFLLNFTVSWLLNSEFDSLWRCFKVYNHDKTQTGPKKMHILKMKPSSDLISMKLINSDWSMLHSSFFLLIKKHPSHATSLK